MTVFFNGDSHQFEDNCTLFDALEQLNYANKKGVAIGLNNQVIQKDQWNEIALSDKDKVIVIAATKGG